MRRIVVSFLLLIIVHMVNARHLHRRKGYRSDRVVSVYDRNCFFSPMGCHFVQGRRAMTFITPEELKEEQEFHRSVRQNEQ